MNEIEVVLKESGSTAELMKDFNLFQGCYHNVQISVWVPKSILYASETAGAFSNAVKIGAILTTPKGNKVTTKSYFLDYVKDELREGKPYSVYTRLLPKEFASVSGTQTVVANVLNMHGSDGNPTMVSVTTSQQAFLEVLPSAYLGDDETIEQSTADELNGAINALAERVTTNENDISAIETVNETQNGNIATNTQDISDLRTDVEYLYENMITGEDYIGQMTGKALPTNEELEAFVTANTNPPRASKNGDVVIFILDIPSGTDKNYKYTKTGSGWVGYEIPPVETAGNGTLGIVEGTYGLGLSNEVLVDIAGGQIVGLYYKDTNGVYQNATTQLNTLGWNITRILNGDVSVGLARSAVSDGNGNQIATTYMTNAEGATKAYVQDYALPKSFNDVYYISSAGYVETVPTTPPSGIQFTQTVAAIGAAEIFTVERELQAAYEFSQRNSTVNNIWVASTAGGVLEFKLTTQVKPAGAADWINLSVQLSGEIEVAANTVTRLNFSSNFLALQSNEISLEIGDGFRQIFELVTTDTVSRTISVYSNEIYPSDFVLNSATTTYNVNTLGEPAEVFVAASQFTQNASTGLYEATVPQSAHKQPIGSKYIIQGAYQYQGGTYRAVGLDYSIDSGGDITVFSSYPEDYRILIASAVQNDTKQTLRLINPASLTGLSYAAYGAVEITQTTAQEGALTLPAPESKECFTEVFVINATASTQSITVNGKAIAGGTGVQFKWTGKWYAGGSYAVAE